MYCIYRQYIKLLPVYSKYHKSGRILHIGIFICYPTLICFTTDSDKSLVMVLTLNLRLPFHQAVYQIRTVS